MHRRICSLTPAAVAGLFVVSSRVAVSAICGDSTTGIVVNAAAVDGPIHDKRELEMR